MSFSRRLHKELEELRTARPSYFTDIYVDDSNFLQWHGLLVPSSQPYNKGAFHVQLTFPAEYPFKAPSVQFQTKIYHPNVDEAGQICLPLLNPEHWKPTTRVEQVVEALVAMVDTPQLEHALRPDLAKEYSQNKKKFFKVAEEFTIKYGEKRPRTS